MGTITFFHQERVDGARRTGIFVDDDRALERFVPGDSEDDFDPSLLWYIDVIIPVAISPRTESETVEWLTTHNEIMADVISAAADRMRGGMDAVKVPWSFEIETASGVEARVRLSSQRRFAASQIGEHLAKLLERDWPAFLDQFLPALAAA